MHACMHAFIHTYIHTYIRTYIRMYIHMSNKPVHDDMYVYVYIYIQRAGRCESALFHCFFQNCNHMLKLKLQMKLCSCPLESMYCVKKFPGVHSTLDKCYYSIPSTKHNFCRMCQMTSKYIITTSPCLPTNAVFKTNITYPSE